MTEEMVLGDLFDLRNHLERKFEVYDAENPHIWAAFVRFTYQAINRGYSNFSAKAVVERIRWHTKIETIPVVGEPLIEDRDLKLNNNYPAYYARKFHAAYPQHDGFFRTRELRAA